MADKSGAEACFGCMNRECKRRQDPVIAQNSFNLPLRPGQQVETELLPIPVIIQALSALFPPCLGFAAGFFLTAALFPVSGEAAQAFGGVLLMFIAGTVFYLYRRFRPAKILHRIVRIVDPEYAEIRTRR
jgi:sigma-E factor negative regulatory protein RseC